MQKKQINIDPSAKPLFADEVVVAHTVKQEKDKKGKISKEGYVTLLFVDALSNRAMSRITMSKTTAKTLAQILHRDVENLEKELKSKKAMKAPVTVKGTSESSSYIG